MKGAALSDLHLGFRAFPSTTDGRNTREVDTERAWKEAVDLIVLDQPELVTIAGDVFHHPRVSDYAKQAFLFGIRRLVDDTGAHIIIAQGNHDAGRTADVLTPIALAEGWDDRIFIVTEPRRIRFTTCYDASVSVSCFPFVVGGGKKTYNIDPDPHADVNVLVIHAAVKGSASGDKLPFFYGSNDQALDVGREVDRWDAVHCGDFHEFTRLHPERLAFYSGSLERTSNNIWAEKKEKGVVFYDTETEGMELKPVWNREMLDYEYHDFVPFGLPVDSYGLNDALLELIEVDTEDAIIRLKVEDFPREEREHIDWSLVRKLKSLCTHFYLDIRYAAPEVADLGDRRDKSERLSLAEEAASFLKDDPEEVRDLAIHFLDIHAEVEDAEEAEA